MSGNSDQAYEEYAEAARKKASESEARKASLPGVPDLQKVKRRSLPADFDPTAHIQSVKQLEAQGKKPQAASTEDYLGLLQKSS